MELFSIRIQRTFQLVSTSVLEEGVSNRQVLLLGHASFVFSALICASFVSQVPALICLSWFMVALRLCVKGGLG